VGPLSTLYHSIISIDILTSAYIFAIPRLRYLAIGPKRSISISSSKSTKTCSFIVVENAWSDRFAMGFIKY
jgi:hypothetical protein